MTRADAALFSGSELRSARSDELDLTVPCETTESDLRRPTLVEAAERLLSNEQQATVGRRSPGQVKLPAVGGDRFDRTRDRTLA